MKLGCALVASDLNPEYLEFFPLVRRTWMEVVGVPALLVLIADAIPPGLEEHADSIRLLPPLPDVHTAFQAQCVRLLYPALLEEEAAGGAVLTSDIDMIPMNRPYYVDSIRALPDDRFAILRSNVLMADAREIAICYNAALPRTWRDLFDGPADVDGLRRRLGAWAAGRADYDGLHGGTGWNTDQRLLFDQVVRWMEGAGSGRVACLTDGETGYRRLDRLDMMVDGGLTERDAEDARAGRFTDCHMMRPSRRHHDFNAAVAALPPRVVA